MIVSERIDRLIDTWCGERHTDALRILLPVWPVAMDLTDEWARVFERLQTVREQVAARFTEAEKTELDAVILEVGRLAVDAWLTQAG